MDCRLRRSRRRCGHARLCRSRKIRPHRRGHLHRLGRSLARGVFPGHAYDVSTVIEARTGERFVAACPPNDCCLVTSSRVAGAAEKKRLASTYEAALVDMEAAGVARLAKMRGIPFYCVKGISDGPSDQLPDFK